jgi:hypothetical protein
MLEVAIVAWLSNEGGSWSSLAEEDYGLIGGTLSP